MAGSFLRSGQAEGLSDADKLPAYVATEINRIVADEEAFECLVDLFKKAHGRAPASDCEAYQWGARMEDPALTAMGFEGRAGFQYNYDLCLMVEYGPG